MCAKIVVSRFDRRMAFVPEGRSKSLSVPHILAFRVPQQVVPTLLRLASNLSHDPFNRPAGTGYFPHDSRHFVPGYYRAVPGGQNFILTSHGRVNHRAAAGMIRQFANCYVRPTAPGNSWCSIAFQAVPSATMRKLFAHFATRRCATAIGLTTG